MIKFLTFLVGIPGAITHSDKIRKFFRKKKLPVPVIVEDHIINDAVLFRDQKGKDVSVIVLFNFPPGHNDVLHCKVLNMPSGKRYGGNGAGLWSSNVPSSYHTVRNDLKEHLRWSIKAIDEWEKLYDKHGNTAMCIGIVDKFDQETIDKILKNPPKEVEITLNDRKVYKINITKAL